MAALKAPIYMNVFHKKFGCHISVRKHCLPYGYTAVYPGLVYHGRYAHFLVIHLTLSSMGGFLTDISKGSEGEGDQIFWSFLS